MQTQLLSCAFVKSSAKVPVDRWHAAIVMAIQGEARVNTERQQVTLSPMQGDILVANPGETGTLTLAGDALAATFRLDVRQVRRMVNDRSIWFSLDPTMRHQERYAELRQHLQAMIRACYEGGDFVDLHRSAAEFDVLRCLLDGYATTSDGALNRADQLRAYVDSHYDEPLGLAEVARHFHVSSEYLAKLFKREVGQTMLEYLTAVRLEAACVQLTETDDTVARIALQTGFPNVASLNQAFKRRFEMTPTQYRAAHAKAKPREDAGFPTAIARVSEEGANRKETRHDLVIDLATRATSLRPWRDMLGIGEVESLREARVREQVLWLYQQLGFAHGRISCDFSKYQDPAGIYRLEETFDFLLSTGIVPHVCMHVQPGTDADAYAEAASAAIRRFVNRYSLSNVRTWRFELRCRSGLDPADPLFVSLFERAAQGISHLGTKTPLLGPGCPILGEASNLRPFLRAVRQRGIALGGMTISVRPSNPANQDEGAREVDRRSMRNQVLLAREALSAEGFDPDLLVVGGWSDTLSSTNVLNDTCFEGANICQQLLSCQDLVSTICYDWALDALCPSVDTPVGQRVLSGKPGLLTRDGIPKPSYAAFSFLNHIGDHVVHASERCVASINEMGNLQIVCHHCERLGARYVATPEHDLTFEEVPTYFENPGPRTVNVRIDGIKRGTYLIKTRTVNAEGGSVADAAQRMRLWCTDDPGRSEIAYLRACAQPQMRLEVVLCLEGSLAFSHELMSNEIAYFHVIYLY